MADFRAQESRGCREGPNQFLALNSFSLRQLAEIFSHPNLPSRPCFLIQTREVLHTNSTMRAVHMIVHRISLRESLHAHPTDMDSTSRAGHMIAAERLLDHGATLGAILDAEFLLGRPQCLVTAGCTLTVLATGQTIV